MRRPPLRPIAPTRDLRDFFDEDRDALARAEATELEARILALTRALEDGDSRVDSAANLATALVSAGDVPRAVGVMAAYRHRHADAAAIAAFAKLLVKCGRLDEALAELAAGRRLHPLDVSLQMKHALTLPIVYASAAQIESSRARYEAGLDALLADCSHWSQERSNQAWEAVQAQHNFYLAYQGRNDREPQRKYAAYVDGVAARAAPHLASARVECSGGRMKVGFVSAHMREHSVTKMFLGWLRAGAARPFDVFAIDVGRNGDHVTAEILRSADHYEQLAGPVESMAARIRAYGLDAIVFLDVGMGGPVTGVLSAFRLAPVQCATWGHPQTTGSPHVDYFFSSDAMEPADGQDHYTESLVRLPGIGMPYRKPLIPRPVLNPSRSAFGLRDGDVIYLCCQNVSKYLPQRDHVLAEIAAKVPHARFVFIVPNVAIGDALLERMGAPFAAEGLDARDHCVFLGHLDAFRYWELHLCADVFLDSLDWAGCNSSLEAMACGVPIVAFRGPLMRARHTTAFLERIGMGEWVATDADAFVDLAMRLGRDAALRSQVGRSVEHAVGVLCEADRSTEALDDFLVSAIRGRSRGR